MTIPARTLRFNAQSADHAALDVAGFDHDGFDILTLDADDRICAPPRRTRRPVLSVTLLLCALLGTGWLAFNGNADQFASLLARVEDLTQRLRALHGAAVEDEVSSIATGALVVHEMPADAPVVIPDAPATASIAVSYPHEAGGGQETAATPYEEGSTDADMPPEPSDEASTSQPLPPPSVDENDPHQKRAAAVGLHPRLSRVLLARLSTADYSNARYAIDTAIAKTSDTGEFVWPRQRKPEQALFRVHFVQGAAAPCRRYVVTVVKDGWSTTAPPMERCDGASRSTKSARAS